MKTVDRREILRTKKLFALLLAAIFWIGLTLPGAADEPITYRLKWLFNTSVVGDLYADSHHLFTQEGLSVTIKEGGPERDAIRELELGRAQFGVASADQVIRALSKGAEVVVIAQFFQVNPLQWMYRPDKIKINRLIDLKGQVLGVTFGGNDETILRTLLAEAGLTEADVKLYSVRYDYTPFIQKIVNFWPVYRNTQAVFLSDKLRGSGDVFAFFNPADYGVRFVANSL
ncbi:MAG: ABC transporter substrate-binding protein, partial [Desulfobacterales bacterium]